MPNMKKGFVKMCMDAALVIAVAPLLASLAFRVFDSDSSGELTE
jgi:hypothetical protein